MSIAEFFSMGGFGFFIWTSFGIALLLIIIEVLMLKSHRHTVVKRLQRVIRARQRS